MLPPPVGRMNIQISLWPIRAKMSGGSLIDEFTCKARDDDAYLSAVSHYCRKMIQVVFFHSKILECIHTDRCVEEVLFEWQVPCISLHRKHQFRYTRVADHL